ncbi:glycosyltransferase [Luteolibacter yonseiensis]|uniref:Glycosyltransferase n=1 Tax=Luteolibacter yonseiensis TaxID=1144680 RepID=A0A934R542_9BACT|nr:glycosyltransferase [Luteolibacter yonseiensis]MBK1817137.1 glycosyltransferase [Luteolibacter yonseiensis]
MDPVHGGPCQGIRNSIPSLAKLGVANEVVSLDPPSAPFLGNDPFPIHAVGPAKGSWGYGAALVPWLVDNLPKFEAVIVHGLWLHHGYAVRKALSVIRRRQPAEKVPRMYVMPHGMLDPYFQRDPSRRLKALRNLLYWNLMESKNVAEADGVLFTCEEELRLARETFRNYSPKREINVGYGVAAPPSFRETQRDSFQAAGAGLADRPYLLFLSRIHPKKGVDLLIHAFASLVKERSAGLEGIPSLVIAGPLDSIYADEMRALAADCLAGLPPGESHPRIHFVGMLQGDAKWGAFYGCEAFVLPSHQENFGIAVVEALACGKPVIISDKVNIWREIDGAGAGMVADDSVEGTKESLSRWFSLTDAEKKEMAGNAMKCFTGHYRMENVAKTFAETLSATP